MPGNYYIPVCAFCGKMLEGEEEWGGICSYSYLLRCNSEKCRDKAIAYGEEMKALEKKFELKSDLKLLDLKLEQRKEKNKIEKKYLKHEC